MPLETGTWTINSNGVIGQLVIASVGADGSLFGSLVGIFVGLGSVQVSGWWDEISQKIVFESPAVNQQAMNAAVYSGFMFQDTFRMPGLTGSVVFTLAGSFVCVGPVSGSSTPGQHVFGWYAQIGVT